MFNDVQYLILEYFQNPILNQSGHERTWTRPDTFVIGHPRYKKWKFPIFWII